MAARLPVRQSLTSLHSHLQAKSLISSVLNMDMIKKSKQIEQETNSPSSIFK